MIDSTTFFWLLVLTALIAIGAWLVAFVERRRQLGIRAAAVLMLCPCLHLFVHSVTPALLKNTFHDFSVVVTLMALLPMLLVGAAGIGAITVRAPSLPPVGKA